MMNQHAEQVAIAVSQKTTIFGAATTGASFAAEKSGVLEAVAAPGPEIVNLCAIVGVILTALGVACSIYFQARRDRREARESRWRMGDPDRRGSHDDD